MSEIVLHARNLTKYYGKRLALDHLNLHVPKGCVYGLLGRNGSGKTTAIKLMLGLLGPTSGWSSVFGRDSQRLTSGVRQRIGYVTEGHHLYRWMQIGRLEDFQRAFFRKSWDSRLFNDMLEYFELSRKQKIKSLSNGQRAQVSLALAMAPNPDMLIMDDPTLGLDAAIRRQFLEGMIQLIQHQGKTILFSSHILSDVERVADRIAVIEKGVLRADCTLEEFQTSIKKVMFTFTGGVAKEVALPGILHRRQKENRLELTLVGTTGEEIDAWAERSGAASRKYAEMSLEDQFVEFTSRQDKRLFQWEDGQS